MKKMLLVLLLASFAWSKDAMKVTVAATHAVTHEDRGGRAVIDKAIWVLMLRQANRNPSIWTPLLTVSTSFSPATIPPVADQVPLRDRCDSNHRRSDTHCQSAHLAGVYTPEAKQPNC